ncbi:UBAP1-MVB12-associated (UMA)-domain containing protein 1 isoform X3 [Pangasianodon hypophthalmus]|uniref:UBAP1-MVB12-associated (UMA)-domain containing protein 1 isoform X3 n=1 Tax=Pangasianodon hypophthalmus TaxID=310915 RepID=UPI002307F791|nr:UBAP1-MVB12-associated (UMA)-domain containing protein 1 isoform X3 [Pangasianodon hypophthalmus]
MFGFFGLRKDSKKSPTSERETDGFVVIVEQSSANQNPRSRPVHSYAPYLKTLHRTGEHGHRPRSRGASRRHPLHPSASHPRHAGRPASASRLHPAPRHQREPGQLLLRLHAGELGAVRAVTADP